MAIMYPDTTLRPSKLELLAAWLPSQPWFGGDAAELVSLGSYRLDDPAGEVGLEGHLLDAGDGLVYHVPLSYRADPIEGGDAHLLGTSEHGVLGTRWFSDAAADPVYRAVLTETIVRGGHEAEEFNRDSQGEITPRERLTRVRGSGRPGAAVPDFSSASMETVGAVTQLRSGAHLLEILRVIDTEGAPAVASAPGVELLSAHWHARAWPSVIAVLSNVGS